MKKSCPSHLSPEARKLWTRLTAEFELGDAAGQLLLQSALECFDRMQQARRLIAVEGVVARDRWGQAKPNPACAVERDARAGLYGALRLLRLAPDSLEDEHG